MREQAGSQIRHVKHACVPPATPSSRHASWCGERGPMGTTGHCDRLRHRTDRRGDRRSRGHCSRGVLALDRRRLERLHADDQRHDRPVLWQLVQQYESGRARGHHLHSGHPHRRWRWRLHGERHQHHGWCRGWRGTGRGHHSRLRLAGWVRALQPSRVWWRGWFGNSDRWRGRDRRERLRGRIDHRHGQRGCRWHGPRGQCRRWRRRRERALRRGHGGVQLQWRDDFRGGRGRGRRGRRRLAWDLSGTTGRDRRHRRGGCRVEHEQRRCRERDGVLRFRWFWNVHRRGWRDERRRVSPERVP